MFASPTWCLPQTVGKQGPLSQAVPWILLSMPQDPGVQLLPDTVVKPTEDPDTPGAKFQKRDST